MTCLVLSNSNPIGGGNVKNGKRLTLAQKKLLIGKRLNYKNWLVERNTSTETVFVHRHSDKEKRVVTK